MASGDRPPTCRQRRFDAARQSLERDDLPATRRARRERGRRRRRRAADEAAMLNELLIYVGAPHFSLGTKERQRPASASRADASRPPRGCSANGSSSAVDARPLARRGARLPERARRLRRQVLRHIFLLRLAPIAVAAAAAAAGRLSPPLLDGHGRLRETDGNCAAAAAAWWRRPRRRRDHGRAPTKRTRNVSPNVTPPRTDVPPPPPSRATARRTRRATRSARRRRRRRRRSTDRARGWHCADHPLL